MNNNRVEQAFFFLLRSGLWREIKGQADCFPLTHQEWFQLYSRAMEQTVEGVLFDGLQFLEKKNLPPSGLRVKWLVRIDMIERHNLRSNTGIAEQFKFFLNKGLRPVLLKGQGVASTYSVLFHRISGDIDWYFEGKEQFHLAHLLLTKAGTAVATQNGALVYHWKDTEIDLHNRIFDLYNPFSRNLLKRIREQYPDTKLWIAGENITILAPIVQIIQVVAHILKHSLAFGIGLRQFCDLACLYATYTEELDGKKLKCIYEELGLIRWIMEVHELLIDYIGLSPDQLPFPIKKIVSSLSIIDDVWNGGNFGFHDKEYAEMKDGYFLRRKNRSGMLFRQLLKYFPYVPKEAFWFPIIHFSNKNSD